MPRTRSIPSDVLALAALRLNEDAVGRRWAAVSLTHTRGVRKWRFQQDGETAHSVKKSAIVDVTLALIEAHASIVEPWPPTSANMSAIEKVWAYVEEYMWAHLTWHGLASFRVALHKAWAEAITPEILLKTDGGDPKYVCSSSSELRERDQGMGAHCKGSVNFHRFYIGINLPLIT